jgi:hypothetical protein
MSVFLARLWAAVARTRRRSRPAGRSRAFSASAVDGLEQRIALSATTPVPAIQMLSASTADSRSITIEYRINQTPGAADAIELGIYRATHPQFDANDSLVGTATLAAPGSNSPPGAITADQSGRPATAIGTHSLTIPLAQGLPPYPAKPFVLVVAGPGTASAATEPGQVASFRVETIGIVTHGGIQDPSWKHGPPWQRETAFLMRHEGFDAVIPFTWVQQSSTPGQAIKQSPKLARKILKAASTFPPGDPVDLEFIGHSEGTVVNTYAIVILERSMTPELRAGDIEEILLDPHAANNNVPGQQMSSGGVLGGLAHAIVGGYQGRSGDPPVFIPPAVDQALVFFQHSQATAAGIYNLWGQVPVKSAGPVVHYYNLTDLGATHSGQTGVNYWFRDFIAPTLGMQAPLIQALQLNGQIDGGASPSAVADRSAGWSRRVDNAWSNRVYGPATVVSTARPEFSGTAAPDSIIRLGLSPAAAPRKPIVVGVTHATGAGRWSVSPWHPLRNGQYRTIVAAFSRGLATRPGLAIVPTQPLGRLVVDAPPLRR